MNLHNIGQGFSKMLQTVSTDSLNKDIKKGPSFQMSAIDMADEEDNDGTLPLPSIKREFLSDNEEEVRKFKNATPRRNR